MIPLGQNVLVCNDHTILSCHFYKPSCGFQKSTEDRGLLCLQASCGHRMSPSEVSRRLEEVRDGLEKAVDLMERDRPG